MAEPVARGPLGLSHTRCTPPEVAARFYATVKVRILLLLGDYARWWCDTSRRSQSGAISNTPASLASFGLPFVCLFFHREESHHRQFWRRATILDTSRQDSTLTLR